MTGSRNCIDCWYRTRFGVDFACGYLLKTGQRRPCPAGDGCTVKIGRKVYHRKGRKK